MSTVNVIIWDFDNTLYQGIPELGNDVRRAELMVIEHHTGWTREKAEREFYALYKTVYVSATQTVAVLSGIPFVAAAIEMEDYFDRTKYLQFDQKLVDTFASLRSYRHFILTNGAKAPVTKALQILGLSSDVFEEIVTSEVTGTNKPDPKAFQYILDKTTLPPEAHLMIGDRREVDLVPAKHLGMKTCLVWSTNQPDDIDVSLPTVYQVPAMIPSL